MLSDVTGGWLPCQFSSHSMLRFNKGRDFLTPVSLACTRCSTNTFYIKSLFCCPVALDVILDFFLSFQFARNPIRGSF